MFQICGLQDIPSRLTSHCPQCSDLNLIFVLDCSSNVHWTWCSRCQQRGVEVPHSPLPVPQSVGVSGWFSSPSSHIWGVFTDGEILPLLLLVVGLSHGSSVHSSPLALESIEIARGVSHWSTGSRHPVPDPQCEFWCSTALEIIQMFSVHVQSLTHDSEAAQELQHNWDGGEHLSARFQELCSPPHIMSALCAWLVRQCDEFVSPTSDNVVVHTMPSPVSPPPGRHPVPRPSRSAPAVPFSAAAPLPGPSEPANPLSAAAPTVPQVPREAIVASNPSVALHPGRSPAPRALWWWWVP